jgi:hypothetical protein
MIETDLVAALERGWQEMFSYAFNNWNVVSADA